VYGRPEGITVTFSRSRVHIQAMPQSEWAAVDVLIRDLGAIVAAATYVRGEVARAAAEQAIREASVAVNETISDPRSVKLLAAARTAIQTAQDVIVALDEQVARSHALAQRSAALRGRAFELVEQARKAGQQASSDA
jgi:hypothetical protein